ncbi:MAG TPA: matrixin family metalloprotease, partial [Gemmataceae bacterium]|nr:matrixin family metalloprotease [Gemmataceae bacterium]
MPASLSGNAWPHPELITISFMPDGTNLGGKTSNLFSTFNNKFGSASTWENIILKAAQTWAQATNINFAVVIDNGSASGAGNYQQGDPGMGDIRIGGYSFAGSSALALTDMPPPVNNYSIAGDMVFNTGQAFNVNRTYDLYTVALHEFGHALGLDHSGLSTAAMYGTYMGVHGGLSNDDISGIESIYSNGQPRSPDAYDAASPNNSFTAAANINGQINTSSMTALVTNLDITKAGELDYYQFTAPAGCGTSLTVKVQSQGLSLLAPTLTLYNGSQTQLATVSGAGHYGTTLTVTYNGLTAGQTYYVKVAGADSSAFGTGAYALTLDLGSNPSPTVPLPNTQTANGNPLSGSGGIAEQQLFLVDSLFVLVGLLSVPDDPRVDVFDVHAPVSSIPMQDLIAAGQAHA